jgi:hypothetical protein
MAQVKSYRYAVVDVFTTLEGDAPSTKTLGRGGGIGPDSTVDYHVSLVQIWRERTKDGS